MIKYIEFSKQLIIQRRIEVCKQMQLGRSTFYKRIQEGLFPPPFSLGERAVGFFAHETNAMIRAMAAGKSNDELKTLVKILLEYRKNPSLNLHELEVK